ncbi:MAG: uncharacterized protein A8A55_2277 [Amphiamblys sp. WSBS2006]|nr:MAG: uncharacterized protein A8A55_2277 [Amphiamblys sp. WSBS2006]
MEEEDGRRPGGRRWKKMEEDGRRPGGRGRRKVGKKFAEIRRSTFYFYVNAALCTFPRNTLHRHHAFDLLFSRTKHLTKWNRIHTCSSDLWNNRYSFFSYNLLLFTLPVLPKPSFESSPSILSAVPLFLFSFQILVKRSD